MFEAKAFEVARLFHYGVETEKPGIERGEKWFKANDKFAEEVRPVFAALEFEFQKLLGVESVGKPPNHSA